MNFDKIDQVIEECDQHLTTTNAFGTEIEAYLTRYLLIFIYSEFERKLEDMFIERAARSKDTFVEAFVSSNKKSIFKTKKTSGLKETLGKISVSHRESFETIITEQQETFYNNIIINRHDTAHEKGASLSFNDLRLFYSVGKEVLVAFNNVVMGS